ncbi:MAG: hypothetical protein JSR18_05190 [Proteobacteria bacterium]|nr:hypothetical protein [Pseudomonadota bacterium]
MSIHTFLRFAWAVGAGCVLAGAANGVGTGGTGLRHVYVRGAVAPGSGLVLNGTTFDARRAGVVVNSATASAADVLPGMVADVAGTVTASGSHAIASTVSVSRVVRGVVVNVGTGGTGLSVGHLGVKATAATVLAGAAAMSALAPGDTIDVYGDVDVATAVVTATRIERIAPVPGIELRGIVTAVTAGALTVDGVAVDTSGATYSGFAGTVRAGDSVVVVGADAPGGIVASSVSADVQAEPADGDEGEIEGRVVALLDGGLFQVAGVTVDASAATFSGGSLTDVVAGVEVHVDGVVVDGVLVARTVELGETDGTAGETESEDVDGPITAFASPASFVVDGYTIDASAASFVNGKATDLKNGVSVKVVGTVAGKRMVATQVTLPRAPGGTELLGTITALRGTARFSIGASPVDARHAVFVGASARTLRIGANVDVAGTWHDGTFVATRVTMLP